MKLKSRWRSCHYCKRDERTFHSCGINIDICDICINRQRFLSHPHECLTFGCFFSNSFQSSSISSSTKINSYYFCKKCIMNYKRQCVQHTYPKIREVFYEKSSTATKSRRTQRALAQLHINSPEYKCKMKKIILHPENSSFSSLTESIFSPATPPSLVTKVVRISLESGISCRTIMKIHSNITKYQFSTAMASEINLFVQKFYPQIADLPLPYARIPIQSTFSVEPGLSSCIVIQGDGRNLSGCKNKSNLDSTIIGYKRIKSTGNIYQFIPLVNIWASEMKDVLPNFLKLIQFEEEIQTFSKNNNLKILLCTDMKFIWVIRGQTFWHCPVCGASRDEIKIDQRGKGIEFLTGIFTQIPWIFDTLHTVLRCFEGIWDFIDIGYMKMLRNSEERCQQTEMLSLRPKSDINTDGKLRMGNLKSHDRKSILKSLQITLTQLPYFALRQHLIQLVSSFNSLLHLLESENSNIDDIFRESKNLQESYSHLRSQIIMKELRGLFYFHLLSHHSAETYQKFGNFKKYRTDECESSHTDDNKRFHYATEQLQNGKTALKMMIGSYIKNGYW